MVEIARPDQYAELIMPAVVRMSTTPGYADCFPALLTPDAMAILLGNVQQIANSEHVFLLVDRASNGDAAGFLLGGVHPQWYSTELEGVQEFLWVEPEYRRGLVVHRLLRRFEEECAKRGAAFVIIGVSSGYRVGAFSKMASRMGYNAQQVNFKKCIRR